MKAVDIAYIAGIVDGEGYIGIKKTSAYKCQDRVNNGYHARIQIRMVDEQAIKFISETLGGWYHKEKQMVRQRRPLYCFYASDKAAEIVLKTILPFLRVKKKSAETVLALRRIQSDSRKHRTKITGYRQFPNQYGTARMVANLAFSDEYMQSVHSLYEKCKALNKTGA